MAFNVSYTYTIHDRYSAALAKIATKTRAFSKDVQGLNRVLGTLNKRIAGLNRTTPVAGANLTQLGRKSVTAARGVKTLATHTGSMAASSSAFNKGFRSMSRTVTKSNFQSKLRRISNDLLGFRGIMFSLAIGAGAKKAISTVVDFETSFNRLSAITFAPKAQMAKFRAKARALGETTRFTASQVMAAMGELALRGLKGKDVLKAIPKTLTLAAASMMALPEAAKFGITTIKQYALELSDLGRVSNVLAKGQTMFGATIGNLKESLRTVGPLARVAGLDLERTIALLGVMSESGEVGSRAGTLLKNSLVKMLVPTTQTIAIFKQMEKKTKGKVKWMNFFSPEGRVDVEALVRVLEKFPQLQRIAMKLFNIRGGQALVALAGQGADKVRDFEKALRSAEGFAAEAARRQMAGLPGVFLMLKSAAESVELSLFGATGAGPTLGKVLTRFTGALRKFARMNPEMTRMMGVIALVSVGMMGLLVVLALTASAIGALLSPVGLVVVGVTALAAAFGLAAIGVIQLPRPLQAALDVVIRFKNEMQGAWEAVETLYGRLRKMPVIGFLFTKTFDFIGGQVKVLITIIAALSKVIGGMFLLLIPGSAKQGFGLLREAWDNVSDISLKNFIPSVPRVLGSAVQPTSLMESRSFAATIQGLIRVQADPGSRITEATTYPAHGPQLGVNMMVAE